MARQVHVVGPTRLDVERVAADVAQWKDTTATVEIGATPASVHGRGEVLLMVLRDPVSLAAEEGSIPSGYAAWARAFEGFSRPFSDPLAIPANAWHTERLQAALSALVGPTGAATHLEVERAFAGARGLEAQFRGHEELLRFALRQFPLGDGLRAWVQEQLLGSASLPNLLRDRVRR